MPVFLIAEIKITDDAWVPEYAARVHVAGRTQSMALRFRDQAETE
ncbi:MAG: hypothetical protein PVG91_06590 [Gammaproteobacteria bacterium]|jgi:hypothetical protein